MRGSPDTPEQIELASPESPELQADSLPTEPPGKAPETWDRYIFSKQKGERNKTLRNTKIKKNIVPERNKNEFISRLSDFQLYYNIQYEPDLGILEILCISLKSPLFCWCKKWLFFVAKITLIGTLLKFEYIHSREKVIQIYRKKEIFR